jgi:hypothetical protein
MLCGEEQVAFLHNNSQCTSSDEELTKLGIVQIGNEGKLHFIHRTFGEFYGAGYFVNELKGRSNFSEEIQDLLLKKVFQLVEYRMIRVFIDVLLSSSKPSNEAKNQYGERIHDLGEAGELTLHTASNEGNVNIIAFLLDSLEVTGHRDTLAQLLLARDRFYEHNAFYVATTKSQLEVLHKLWELAEKELTPDERKKLLLAPDNFGRTAWRIASELFNMSVIKQMWKWANEVITPEEIKNNIFQTKGDGGRTVWYAAVYYGHLEILYTYVEWAKLFLTSEEIKEYMFLTTDDGGRTVWHTKAESGNLELLCTLMKWA